MSGARTCWGEELAHRPQGGSISEGDSVLMLKFIEQPYQRQQLRIIDNGGGAWRVSHTLPPSDQSKVAARFTIKAGTTDTAK